MSSTTSLPLSPSPSLTPWPLPFSPWRLVPFLVLFLVAILLRLLAWWVWGTPLWITPSLPVRAFSSWTPTFPTHLSNRKRYLPHAALQLFVFASEDFSALAIA